jgi:hypothetical protein
MTIALWITAILLAFLYLFSGGMKVVRSRPQLEDMMVWVKSARIWQVRMIGALEVLGALGLVLPLATNIAPVLTAVAAICLVLVQLVAIPVHFRVKDVGPQLTLNVVLLLLAIAVAVLRFATL